MMLLVIHIVFFIVIWKIFKYSLFFHTCHYFSGSRRVFVGGKKAKAMKGMKRRAMRKKKAAAAEEAPMKAMRRK